MSSAGWWWVELVRKLWIGVIGSLVMLVVLDFLAKAIVERKVAEAVQTAQEALQGKGWLPQALRIQTAIVATNSEAASAEATSEGGETASDSADIGDADPAQAPDDGGGQTGSTEALITAE